MALSPYEFSSGRLQDLGWTFNLFLLTTIFFGY